MMKLNIDVIREVIIKEMEKKYNKDFIEIIIDKIPDVFVIVAKERLIDLNN
jgi:hypothetical protein